MFSRKYANTIPRQFSVRYNPYTQSIEVLDSKAQLESLMTNLNTEFQSLQNAFKTLKVWNDIDQTMWNYETCLLFIL